MSKILKNLVGHTVFFLVKNYQRSDLLTRVFPSQRCFWYTGFFLADFNILLLDNN